VRPLAPAGFDGPAAGPPRKSAIAAGPLALRGVRTIEDDTTTGQLGAPSGPGTPSELRRAAREPQPSEAIRAVNATPFAVVRIPWQVRPPSFSITVLVKGTFDLVPGGAAKPRAEGDPPAGDRHFDDDPRRSLIHASDYVIFKPKADVTLVGHAHAPGGSASAMEVRFRFGDRDNAFDRRIAVFGERRWSPDQGAQPTTPQAFTKIPVRYENAFGGPDLDANPVGVGHAAAVGSGEGARLPSLEDPRQLLASPAETAPPACFAPIAPGWAQRQSKLGTYDSKWRRTRAPYYPKDFDWASCQSAPGPQQLEYLRGDEPFEIVGMHPDHPTIEGTLPQVRARCFAQMTDKAGRAFQEVMLRLDTAAFDADAMTVSLCWRGLLEVTREDAPEIESLFVLAEDLQATPATLEEAHVRFLWALVPSDPGPASVEVSGPTQISPIELSADQRRELAAGLGLLEPPDLEIEGTQLLVAPGIAEPATPAAPLSEAAAMVLARLDAGESLAGVDLQGADLSDLDLDGRSLAGANLKDARLLRCKLRNSNLEDTQLEGADLTGADLGGSNLDLANFHGACLVGAVLDGAAIARADFADAKGARASFQGAAGAYAVFAGGDWTDARFDGLDVANANFMGAILDRAVFTRAKLPRALLFQARGTGAVFDGVAMAGAVAERANLVESSFSNIAAEGSSWQAAVVSRSTFEGAMLKAASFIGATCVGTVFSRADISKGGLRDANLSEAVFVGADLTEASLERADLTQADLRGANLTDAELLGAKLDLAKRDQDPAGKP
jgi:uncharacterized protein YjbI with pentapeptide repeats